MGFNYAIQYFLLQIITTLTDYVVKNGFHLMNHDGRKDLVDQITEHYSPESTRGANFL